MRVKRMSVLRIVCREHDREDDEDDDEEDEVMMMQRMMMIERMMSMMVRMMIERSLSSNGIMHIVGSSHHASPAAPSTHWPPG